MALVAVASVTGVAAVMLNHPGLFTALKYCGGGYLVYLDRSGAGAFGHQGWSVNLLLMAAAPVSTLVVDISNV